MDSKLPDKFGPCVTDYLHFADLQDCKTPKDVLVALSLAAQPKVRCGSASDRVIGTSP